MGNGNHGTGEVFQKTFQPGHRFRIQVIGGFVQNQHVGVGQQQAAQRNAAFFTTRQVFNFCFPGGQAQGVGGYFKFSFQLPGSGGIYFFL